MKRFIDTEIMVRPWFRKLEPRLKLLWLWMMTQCDMAGVIDMDWELASFAIGEKVKESDLESMNDNAKVLRGSKLWLPRFVEFQYGVLGGESRVHKGILKTLESHGIGYHKGMLTPKDKDKDKDKDGSVGGCKGEDVETPPNDDDYQPPDLPPVLTLAECAAHADRAGYRKSSAENYFEHYQAHDWTLNGKTRRMTKEQARTRLVIWCKDERIKADKNRPSNVEPTSGAYDNAF